MFSTIRGANTSAGFYLHVIFLTDGQSAFSALCGSVLDSQFQISTVLLLRHVRNHVFILWLVLVWLGSANSVLLSGQAEALR